MVVERKNNTMKKKFTKIFGLILVMFIMTGLMVENVGAKSIEIIPNEQRTNTIFRAGNYHIYAINNKDELYMYKSNGESKKIMKNAASIYSMGFDPSWNNGSIYIIKKDNTLWAWGENKLGQLGDDTGVNQDEPIRIMKNVKNIIISGQSVYAIKTDNSLWAWGNNDRGQLGDGTYERKYKPIKILSNVKECYSYGQYAIKTDGTLWAWGFGTNFSFVKEDNPNNNPPKPRKIMDNIKSFYRNNNGTYYVIKSDNTLMGWGNNYDGQIGNGKDKEFVNNPVKILKDVAYVSIHGDNTFCIKTDGTLWAWGNNRYSDLGDGSTIQRKKPVKIMNDVVMVIHTFALKNDGTLWGWGENNLGITINNNKKSKPIKITDNVEYFCSFGYSIYGQGGSFIKKDGTYWAWGMDTNNLTLIGDGATENDDNIYQLLKDVKIPKIIKNS